MGRLILLESINTFMLNPFQIHRRVEILAWDKQLELIYSGFTYVVEYFLNVWENKMYFLPHCNTHTKIMPYISPSFVFLFPPPKAVNIMTYVPLIPFLAYHFGLSQ